MLLKLKANLKMCQMLRDMKCLRKIMLREEVNYNILTNFYACVLRISQGF